MLTAALGSFIIKPMKSINAAANKVFAKLIAGLTEPGKANKFDKHNYDPKKGGIMPVYVDFIAAHTTTAGLKVELYAVAHRYIVNGDSVCDPDVEFWVLRDADGSIAKVCPLAVDHGIGYRRYVELDGNYMPAKWNPRGQKSLATFCGTWFKNIKEHQGL